MSSVVSTGAPRTGRRVSARSLVLAGISLGYFMVLLDMTVLSVAEPDLAASLHSSVAGLQWVVTAYTVVFGALLLSSGAVADRYGAHRVFRFGVAAFGGISLLCAIAPNVWTLSVLRAVGGMAAAAIVPASMVIISVLYPQAAARTKAVAVWAAISGAALAAGPVAGGVLVQTAGWRSIFLINAPLAAITLVLTAGRAVRCPRGTRRIDWPGQVLAGVALALLTDALIALGSHASAPWSVRGWHAVIAAVAAAVAGGLLVARERRSVAPVLPPAVLGTSGIRPLLLAGAAVNFAMAGMLFVLPLLFLRGMSLPEGQVGLAFLPMTIPFAVNPPLTGRLVARVGPRPPVLAGLWLLASAGALLAVGVWAHVPYPLLGLGLAAVGFGVSLTLPALVAAIIAAAPPGSAGAAGGLLNAVRQVGATLGVAATGAFVTVDSDVANTAPIALLLCGAVCLLAIPGIRGVGFGSVGRAACRSPFREPTAGEPRGSNLWPKPVSRVQHPETSGTGGSHAERARAADPR